MNILIYLKEVKQELSKVTWPNRQSVIRLTGVILVVSLITGLYVGGLDLLFTNILGIFLK